MVDDEAAAVQVAVEGLGNIDLGVESSRFGGQGV